PAMDKAGPIPPRLAMAERNFHFQEPLPLSQRIDRKSQLDTESPRQTADIPKPFPPPRPLAGGRRFAAEAAPAIDAANRQRVNQAEAALAAGRRELGDRHIRSISQHGTHKMQRKGRRFSQIRIEEQKDLPLRFPPARL